MAGAGQGNIENQDRPRLHIHDSRRWLTKLHRAFAAQQLASAFIDESDPDGVDADLGTPASHPKHQVGAGIHRREVRQPHVLEHSQHAELALLIDQGVVGDDGKIEMQGSDDPDRGDDVVLLDLVHHIHPLGNLAEDRVHLIEMGLGRVGNEELTAARILAGMSHR